MTFLGASLMLCSVLTLSRAGPLNSTYMPKKMGRCYYQRNHDQYKVPDYVPKCDDQGNFLPQQCCGLTEYCWCVDVVTGDMVPNTKRKMSDSPYDCKMDHYCPKDWTYNNGQCYMFINQPKTWGQAERYCRYEKASLASIHSYEDDYFLKGLCREDYSFVPTWAGGHNTVEPDLLLWSDGTYMDYMNFYSDYYMGESGCCMIINYGFNKKWHYDACNDTHPFVCGKKK